MISSPQSLLAAIGAIPHRAHQLKTSARYLDGQRTRISQYTDIVDLVLKAEDGDKQARALEHHFLQVRNAYLTALWGNEFLIGRSMLEELLFDVYSDACVQNPLDELTNRLFAVHDLGSGVAVFPLNFVSFPANPLAETPKVVSLNLDSYGVRVYPQANSYERALRHIEEAATALGVPQAVPRELMEHWYQSRPLGWIVNNALLVAKIHQQPGNYYENQVGLVQLAHFGTTLVYGVAALSNADEDAELFSTGSTNNWSTHDHHHYIALYPRGGVELDGDCIPMRKTDPEVVEVTDLNVFLPGDLGNSLDTARLQAFADALLQHRRVLFEKQIGGTRDTRDLAPARLARKLSSALRFFRRSHFTSSYEGERLVSLASAFEVLLTDSYAGAVGETLRLQSERALCSQQVVDWAARSSAIRTLYKARCEVAHAGADARGFQLNLRDIQRSFVICYTAVASGVDLISDNEDRPVDAILRTARGATLRPSFDQRARNFAVGLKHDFFRRFDILCGSHP